MARLCFVIAVLVAISAAPTPARADPWSVHARDAGADAAALDRDIAEMLAFGLALVEEVGLDRAIELFDEPPWKRAANALHFWGLSTDLIHRFDIAHPELAGLDLQGLTDMNGVEWGALAVERALAPGSPIWAVTFPHPETGVPEVTRTKCAPIPSEEGVLLCASGYLEPV